MVNRQEKPLHLRLLSELGMLALAFGLSVCVPSAAELVSESGAPAYLGPSCFCTATADVGPCAPEINACGCDDGRRWMDCSVFNAERKTCINRRFECAEGETCIGLKLCLD